MDTLNRRVCSLFFSKERVVQNTANVNQGRAKAVTSVEAGVVIMYNSNKGFGFIQPDRGGCGIFFHVSELKKAGLSSLEKGQRIEFCGSVQEDERRAAVNLKLLSKPEQLQKSKKTVREETDVCKGRVIKYDSKKCFGYIKCDDDMEDVFFHVKTLKQCGISADNILNHRVMFKVGPGNVLGKTQAVHIKLI